MIKYAKVDCVSPNVWASSKKIKNKFKLQINVFNKVDAGEEKKKKIK